MSSKAPGSWVQLLRDREVVSGPRLLTAKLTWLSPPFFMEKSEGKSLASGAHIIGRQAQIIAMFSSVMVHTEEAMSSRENIGKHPKVTVNSYANTYM